MNTQKQASPAATTYADPFQDLINAPAKVFDPGVKESPDYMIARVNAEVPKAAFQPLRACPWCGGTHWPYGGKAYPWNFSQEDGFTFQENYFNKHGRPYR